MARNPSSSSKQVKVNKTDKKKKGTLRFNCLPQYQVINAFNFGLIPSIVNYESFLASPSHYP